MSKNMMQDYVKDFLDKEGYKVVFISPFYKAQGNYENLVKSIQDQENRNFCHFVINDEVEIPIAFLGLESEYTDDTLITIDNDKRNYALKNIISLARDFEDRDDIIIAVVDGDDQLCNPKTVDILIDEYKNGSEVVWTAHKWDIDGRNISKEMPNHVDPYQWPWCASHLRTFKASLLQNISDNNFKDFKGEWFKRGYDQALMLPILKQTNKRKYVPEVCYQYNIDSCSIPKETRNWEEKTQISTISFVRSRGFLK